MALRVSVGRLSMVVSSCVLLGCAISRSILNFMKGACRESDGEVLVHAADSEGLERR